MFPVLQIGPVAIQAPGLVLVLGLWMGLEVAERYFRKLRIPISKAYALVVVGLVTAAVGGRLAYAAANFSAFASSPASLISINPDLWNLPGGVILGLIGCFGYGIHHKMDFWSLLDSLTPSFAVMMISAGLANLASGSAFGEPARLPWSIFLWGEWRHPSQIYETVGAAGVLGWILLRFPRLDLNSQSRLASGCLFLEFATWSAVLRIFLELFRGDSVLLLGQLRAAQGVAWILLAISLILIGKRSFHATTSAMPVG